MSEWFKATDLSPVTEKCAGSIPAVPIVFQITSFQKVINMDTWPSGLRRQI